MSDSDNNDVGTVGTVSTAGTVGTVNAVRRRRPHRSTSLPIGWESSGDDYEYIPLRLPPDITRVSASMRLAIQAEYGGWELSRVRLYTDGSRRVLLRRRKATVNPTPGPSL